MTRVLSLVSYPILPARMGGQKGIALFYKSFSTIVSLTVITTKKNDPRFAEGYEVLNTLSDSPLRYINIFYFFRIRKILREKKISHLLLEHPYYGWLAVWLKWSTGVKLVVHSHNMEGLRWKSLGKWWWKWLWRYERWTHRHADYNFFKQPEDLAYAVKNFALVPGKCLEVTYGVDSSSPPDPAKRQMAAEQLRKLHNIPPSHTILLFNGAFNYLPNRNALQRLLMEINPLLQEQQQFVYTLLICGKDIPQEWQTRHFPNTVFAGFVDDISLYFSGADLFLNPITEGGGIKTKIVEAIEHGTSVVSARSGAIGMNIAACGNKLVIVGDGDLPAFAAAVMRQAAMTVATPQSFYDYYNWRHIAARAGNFILTS